MLNCILKTNKLKVALLLVVTLVKAGWLRCQWFSYLGGLQEGFEFVACIWGLESGHFHDGIGLLGYAILCLSSTVVLKNVVEAAHSIWDGWVSITGEVFGFIDAKLEFLALLYVDRHWPQITAHPMAFTFICPCFAREFSKNLHSLGIQYKNANLCIPQSLLN